MKIVHVAPFFYPVEGGMERHVYYLSREILRRHPEYSISVITCDRKHNEEIIFQKHETLEGIEIYRERALLHKGFLTYFPSLRKKLEELNPDIIHVHAYRHPHVKIALKYAKKHGKKIIFTPFAIFTNSAELPFKNKLYYTFYDRFFSGRKFFNKFDAIIALTHFEKDALVKLGADAAKVSVIPCGGCSFTPIKADLCGADNNSDEDSPKNNCNKEPDLDKLFRGLKGNKAQKKFIIGSLSRIHPSKGLDTLIRALAEPELKELDWVYLIVGPDSNNYLNTLLTLANSLGILDKLVYLGPINYKKKEFFENLDLFVSPSKAEALGMTLVEAQSLGVVSIGSDFPPVREVVLDGKTGFLVKFGDSKALAEKIKLLIDNKKIKNELSKNAKHYSSQWSWKNLTDCVERVYDGENVDFYSLLR
ncbi:glycosyltransferase family 4 protein [Candidatus Woesearchaeota archaeon]|nr:glycosyltransferase family 4 protein [Candidatus Woesearchaeota archaeon]